MSWFQEAMYSFQVANAMSDSPGNAEVGNIQPSHSSCLHSGTLDPMGVWQHFELQLEGKHLHCVPHPDGGTLGTADAIALVLYKYFGDMAQSRANATSFSKFTHIKVWL